MKITVKGGMILTSEKKVTDKNGVVRITIADEIAKANKLGTAENFVKKHEGRTFVLNANYKIVEDVKAEGIPVKVRLAGTTRANGKYVFSDEEKANIAKQMAEKHRDSDIVEDEKRSAMSGYKDRLDRIAADINKLTRNYLDGYEFRDFECHVEIDWAANIKRYIAVDGGAVIAERALDPSDYQLKMDMKEASQPKSVDTENK